MSQSHQAIRFVALHTGLSVHAIRVWEKRYGTVAPERTATNRRLYSDEDVERLSLLRNLTQNGHSIGHVARLPTEKLRELARQSPARAAIAPPIPAASSAFAIMDVCLAAVKALDGRALDATLRSAATELGAQGLLVRVVAPLLHEIGELWRNGAITAAHEHFASAVIRVFLGHAAKPFAGMENAPVLLVATPAGQLHELGALLAGATAANLGWHVIYLGASLPAAEIVGAARQNRARAVALSLVYPEDDPRIEGELSRLRETLPAEIPLLIGGRAAPAYQAALNKIGATLAKDLTEFCSKLDEFRKPAAKETP